MATVLVLTAISASLALPIVMRLIKGCNAEEISEEWLASFSPQTYLPMGNLLDEADFDFLSKQPGFDLTLYRKLRRERLQIFQMYLHRMISDFNRLHLAARLMVAHAQQDQSSVLKQLVWLRVRFSASVIKAQFSCHLSRLGISCLPTRALIAQLEELTFLVMPRPLEA